MRQSMDFSKWCMQASSLLGYFEILGLFTLSIQNHALIKKKNQMTKQS